MRMGPQDWMCSFCGTVGSQSTRFAGGLGAMICLDCIRRYSDLLASDPQTKKIEKPPWEGMSDEQLLETAAIDRALHRAVAGDLIDVDRGAPRPQGLVGTHRYGARSVPPGRMGAVRAESE